MGLIGLRGIDISRYQSFNDYNSISDQNIAFAYIKASQGNFVDSAFPTHSLGVAKSGILTGFYHFFDHRFDAITQAKFFCKTILPYWDNFKLIPMIDIEDGNVLLKPKEYEIAIHQFIDEVQYQLKIDKFIIYTNRYYWISKLNNSLSFSDIGIYLWDATYKSVPQTPYGGWNNPLIWQYSASNKLLENTVDTDMFFGSIDDLWGLTNTKTTLTRGIRESMIYAIQRKLEITEDGDFGAETLAKLNAFQAHNNLPVISYLSPECWAKIFNISKG